MQPVVNAVMTQAKKPEFAMAETATIAPCTAAPALRAQSVKHAVNRNPFEDSPCARAESDTYRGSRVARVAQAYHAASVDQGDSDGGDESLPYSKQCLGCWRLIGFHRIYC